MTQAPLFPRVGAFLTGNPADDAVLGYVRALLDGDATERVLFRVASEGELSVRKARSLVKKHLSAAQAKDADVGSCEKDALAGMLRVARDHDLDLIVAGRRLPSSRGGRNAFFGRLSRKAPCSVLLATQHSDPAFDRVLCPVDFSMASGRALRAATALRESLGGGDARVLCQSVFDVPYGSRSVSGSEGAWTAQRRKEGEREFRTFLREHKVAAGKVRIAFTDAHEVAAAVSDLALAARADLVVVGSRGRSAAATMLLGSTAETLVTQCAAPVLVVKEKGETLGFLEAFLGV